jgi:hypothetical protein
MDHWPNWNIFSKFLTLKLENRIQDDYELYFSVLKLCCELSDKQKFCDNIEIIGFLKNVNGYINEELFGANEIVVKGLVIVILGNYLNVQDDVDGPDRYFVF